MNNESEKINSQIIDIKKYNNNIYKHKYQRFNDLEQRSIFIESMLDEIFEYYNFEKKVCPICGHEQNVFLTFAIHYKNAQCAKCTSLERHRFLYLYFKEILLFEDNIKLLHFAPENVFFDLFSKLDSVDYYPVDKNEKPHDLNEEFEIREIVDMQQIPYEDNSFDIILNNHVLEHVPDDEKAMKELYRVIKGEGKCIIMVPIDKTLSETFEDPSHNTPELRTKYYGQEDHVRKYVLDFPEKLKKVGFEVETITPSQLTEKENFKKYGILEDDEIFVCSK